MSDSVRSFINETSVGAESCLTEASQCCWLRPLLPLMMMPPPLQLSGRDLRSSLLCCTCRRCTDTSCGRRRWCTPPRRTGPSRSLRSAWDRTRARTTCSRSCSRRRLHQGQYVRIRPPTSADVHRPEEAFLHGRLLTARVDGASAHPGRTGDAARQQLVVGLQPAGGPGPIVAFDAGILVHNHNCPVKTRLLNKTRLRGIEWNNVYCWNAHQDWFSPLSLSPRRRFGREWGRSTEAGGSRSATDTFSSSQHNPFECFSHTCKSLQSDYLFVRKRRLE